MGPRTSTIAIAGPAGRIDTAVDTPSGEVVGTAVIAHPHPLFGGTRDNKVTQTLARALRACGHVVLRPNFRGVGTSDGTHDEGRGETEDLLHVVAHARELAAPGAPVVLGGFSFGAFVASKAGARLRTQGRPVSRMVLVGVAASRFDVDTVPEDSLVIHGELDDVVPLAAVFDWARPQDLPVTVLPGADHFFHRRLTTIKRLVIQWMATAAPAEDDEE
ncbi:MAG: alpha/beta fold hydrolase [Burkholderiaceae bacterium]